MILTQKPAYHRHITMGSAMNTHGHHVLDARGRVLGRLAVIVAALLRGKHRTCYAYNAAPCTAVTVVNCGHVRISGRKAADKVYCRHSGFPGGLRRTKLRDLMLRSPEVILRSAVRGMLPRNRLREGFMSMLRTRTDEEAGR
ncbi:50S ribosomal protein L13 [Candidatus Tremblaya princeps]|uniref:Large ribosomal subunit protein uL13 n=1 Tax=Tremblaya princeps TaxID=189385 RepID=A0A143WNA3_TREPR|nr:50S ribosomal protein L13 [Candidatus Tremblaya princeps]